MFAMFALVTHHKYHERSLELLVPCSITGEYQSWADSTDLCAVEVAMSDGQILWVDPASLRETDGEPVEDLLRDLYLASSGPVLDSNLLHYMATRHPGIFPWPSEEYPPPPARTS